MHTAAQLRRLAHNHRARAAEAAQGAARAMLLRMAAEFDRDADVAGRQERRDAYLKRAEVALPRPGAPLTALAA